MMTRTYSKLIEDFDYYNRKRDTRFYRHENLSIKNREALQKDISHTLKDLGIYTKCVIRKYGKRKKKGL